jgi:hypothetical protein
VYLPPFFFAIWRKRFRQTPKNPTGSTSFQKVMSGKGSAFTRNMKGELEMTYVDRFEEMPFVGKMLVAFVGVVALWLAGLVGMMLLGALEVLIFGVC